MSELDDVWSQMLASAIENAKKGGRGDVADYLNLKAANDSIRQAGVQWLFDSLIEIAAEANRRNAGIAIEREHPYSFTYKGSNMVGSLLRIRQGVRCLTLEAGWTRTPSDGFMRGGSLAFARINHFGFSKSNVELTMFRPETAPIWKIVSDDRPGEDFGLESLRRHFQILLGN